MSTIRSFFNCLAQTCNDVLQSPLRSFFNGLAPWSVVLSLLWLQFGVSSLPSSGKLRHTPLIRLLLPWAFSVADRDQLSTPYVPCAVYHNRPVFLLIFLPAEPLADHLFRSVASAPLWLIDLLIGNLPWFPFQLHSSSLSCLLSSISRSFSSLSCGFSTLRWSF